jgi:GTP-binding protein
MQIRNIAIIAHVDHGKTTLVDHLFRQSGVFRENQVVEERVMDSMDLERERGITIAAKNCSVTYGDVKINVLDTPGHADFGGEVERALMMVDGAILVVDAAEGPLPQTRFVLRKAFQRNLPIIVVLNKIDRWDARPKEVLNEIYDLFIDLDATEEQIEFPVLYAIAREGKASFSFEEPGTTLQPLFETIVKEIPAPACSSEGGTQLLVANVGYSEYLGRLAVGRLERGTIEPGAKLTLIDAEGKSCPMKATAIQVYEGTSLRQITEVTNAGEIVIVSGMDDVHIGDTIATLDCPEALARISVDEPTIGMRFSANTSPFSGREGKLVQPQKIAARLQREILSNVSLQVEEAPGGESFLVKGRGELQLAIVIETMRREGFELTIGRPQILFKEANGKKLEPIEHVYIDCDEGHVGTITETLSMRKGRMTSMVNHGSGRARLEFSVPSRALIGYRNEFLTSTRGTGILNSSLEGYEEYRGDFPSRQTGSLVSDREGVTNPYGLFNLEPRGNLFVKPSDPVYMGMIVGEHNRPVDLNVNPCKEKKLTNVRASGKDENVQLTPVTPLTLERAIEFIREDEQVEVTPKSIRLRKQCLDPNGRKDRL